MKRSKRALLVPALVLSTALIAACGSSANPAATVVGPATPGLLDAGQVRPKDAQPVQVKATPPDKTCQGRPTTASLAPSGPLPAPGQMPAKSLMATIASRGYMNAGVDQNTLFWGYRNTTTGQLQGFDIDMVEQVAKAIFGADYQNHLRFVIVPNGDRQQFVASGAVDLVAETMTITCARQVGTDGPAVDFSSVYYEASQEVLVPKGSHIDSLSGLNGRRVCADQGSTSRGTVKEAAALKGAQIQLWQAPNETDCLVMLQQGQVDAISTDDTILDGFVAQDPNVQILKDPNGNPIQLAPEPYGMAISTAHPEFVRFVNAVLAQEEQGPNSQWAQMWTQNFKTKPQSPPTTAYRNS